MSQRKDPPRKKPYTGKGPRRNRVEYEQESTLYTYYCLCGQLGCIIDAPLEKLPVRVKDKARVIDGSKNAHKLTCEPSDAVHIRREGGVEIQYRKKCVSCGLDIFYEHKSKGDCPTFVIDGSLKTAAPALNVYNQVTSQKATQKRVMLTKRVHDSGRIGSVTISTIEDDEEELGAKEIADSYKSNAKIVQKQLLKHGLLKKHQADDFLASNKPPKKSRGTLIDR